MLNLDLKLYSKLIANRLQPLMPIIIHNDQVGFIQDRQARDNTLRTISLIAKAQKESIPLGLLSVDAEKAFDRIDWMF